MNLPISAIDTITLAFQHTKRQLIQPFRFWQWTRLAIVGLLAGEMGSGGFNFPTNLNFPKQDGSGRHFLAQEFPKIDPAILGTVIAIAVVAGLIFLLVMAYVSSVMRFVLFDSVLAKECHIRAGWSGRQGPAWKLFLWHLSVILVAGVVGVILVGVPAAFAFAMGWFNSPRDHILPFVLGGIVVFGFLLLFFIALAIVQVLTKDFVVPQMALENIGALEGWRRLWPMIQMEKGGYAIYIGMKIVMALGAGIVIAIVSIFLVLLFAIPVVGVVFAVIFAGKGGGLSWNAFTITAVIVAGCVMFAVFFYLIALISVPAIVFFPAYSIYFFAARYRPLSAVLYPLPPVSAQDIPPPDLPPLPPYPQPAS